MTFFPLLTLPPSQLPPQPIAVEPPTSSSRRPWVPDLQPPSFRSFTLQQTTALCITAANIAPISFLKVPLRSSCADLHIRGASSSSETSRALTRRSKLLLRRSRATRAATRRIFKPRAVTRRRLAATRLHAPSRARTRLTRPHALAHASRALTWSADVISPATSALAASASTILLTSSPRHPVTSSSDR